jgi:mono/diheme cytochrome c family protein
MKKHFKLNGIVILSLLFMLASCGGSESNNKQSEGGSQSESNATGNSNDPMKNKGIGPVQSITLGNLDQAMVDEGQKIYTAKCSACHKAEEKFIGPAPKGIMERRSPEWIMNMILNPEEMVKSDPIAKQLLIDYNLAPMANQHLTQDEARKILEYFRTLK